MEHIKIIEEERIKIQEIQRVKKIEEDRLRQEELERMKKLDDERNSRMQEERRKLEDKISLKANIITCNEHNNLKQAKIFLFCLIFLYIFITNLYKVDTLIK